MKTVAVVMAAGAGARFSTDAEPHGEKLLARFRGKPLYMHAFDALPSELFAAVIVVSGLDEILSSAHERGYIALENRDSAAGVSKTIRLGAEKAVALHADAALYMVADQPLISRETIRNIVLLGEANSGRLIVPSSNGRDGNPVLFPKQYFSELASLTHDTGGKKIVRAHPEAVVRFEVADEAELFDADTGEALAELARLT